MASAVGISRPGPVYCLLMSMFALLVIHLPSCSSLGPDPEDLAGSCDFESEDLCGYVQEERDDFDWRRRTGSTPSENTGPSYDHTYGINGTGYYMYIEGTGMHAWSSAHLISPTITAYPTYCVRFFYHMYGEHTGQLTLYTYDNATPYHPELAWSMLSEQGDEWREATVDIPCESGCKISFEAKPGNGFWSDIAIDDVTVTNGSCWPEGSKPTTSATTTKEASSSSRPPTTKRPTSERGTSSRKPVPTSSRPTADYEIIEYMYDERFITIILAVGLSFWTIVFGIIFCLFCFCDKRSRGGRPGQRHGEIDMELAGVGDEKPGMETTMYYGDISQHTTEDICEIDDNANENTNLKLGSDQCDQAFDDSSTDSERYSVPVIVTPKPCRGPSPPCGYMSLQQDSLNNNDEYQLLTTVNTEIQA